MSFEFLIFLAGTAAIIGPIAAHLFARPRYRRIPFTMLRFLVEGQRESQSRRWFRDLFLLMLRCLAIACIALMFAGPRILTSKTDTESRPLHLLGLDDSLSTAATENGATRFSKLREAAMEYVRSAPKGDAFSLFGLASGQNVTAVDAVQAEAFISSLERPSAGPFEPMPFLAAVRAAASASEKLNAPSVFLASDFTPTTLNALIFEGKPTPVKACTTAVLGDAEALGNAAIIGARSLGASDNAILLEAIVVNYGVEASHRTVSAVADGQTLVNLPLELGPGARRVIPLELPLNDALKANACLPLELRLSEGDVLREDDSYFLAVSYAPAETRRAVLVGADARETFLLSTALTTLADQDALSPLKSETIPFSRFSPSTLRDVDTLVFCSLPSNLAANAEALAAFVQRGGRAVFFLPRTVELSVLHALAGYDIAPGHIGAVRFEAARMEASPARGAQTSTLGGDERPRAALAHYALDRILISGYHELVPGPKAEVLWQFENRAPFLVATPCGDGEVLWVNTSADDSLSDIMKSPAAIAFVDYLLGRESQVRQLSFHTGEQAALPALETEIKTAAAGQPVLLAVPNGRAENAAVVDGLLRFRIARDTGWVHSTAAPLRWAGINVPEGETDLARPAQDVIAGHMQRLFTENPEAEKSEASIDRGLTYHPLWMHLGWAAMALILLEAFVSNRIKR